MPYSSLAVVRVSVTQGSLANGCLISNEMPFPLFFGCILEMRDKPIIFEILFPRANQIAELRHNNFSRERLPFVVHALFKAVSKVEVWRLKKKVVEGESCFVYARIVPKKEKVYIFGETSIVFCAIISSALNVDVRNYSSSSGQLFICRAECY